jgi:hypothetical protein
MTPVPFEFPVCRTLAPGGTESPAELKRETKMDACENGTVPAGPTRRRPALARIRAIIVCPWFVAAVFWFGLWPVIAVSLFGTRPARAVQKSEEKVAPKNLSCESLTVVGPDGRPRAMLEGEAHGARLTFWDEHMRCHMSVALDDNSRPHITLDDKSSHRRASIGLTQDDSPSIRLSDARDHGRATFLMSDAGSPHLVLGDEEGETRMDVRVSDKGLPAIVLSGRKTRQRVAIKFAELGGNEVPMVTFTDQGGNTAMEASVVSGGPSVTLFDREAVRAQLAITRGGTPIFSLGDKNSTPVFILKVGENGVPVIEQRGPNKP